MATIVDKLFPPGEYWVGDLCYVLDPHWGEICDIDFDDYCIMETSDEQLLGTAYTEYGDGSYTDQHGNSYGVDSGTIGVVSVKHMDTPLSEAVKDGHVHTFNHPFSITRKKGCIIIGDIVIDTASYDIDNDEDDFDEYY